MREISCSKKLAKESGTAKEYLKRSHMTAKKISKRYGFSLNYIELPNNGMYTGGDSAAHRSPSVMVVLDLKVKGNMEEENVYG